MGPALSGEGMSLCKEFWCNRCGVSSVAWPALLRHDKLSFPVGWSLLNFIFATCLARHLIVIRGRWRRKQIPLLCPSFPDFPFQCSSSTTLGVERQASPKSVVLQRKKNATFTPGPKDQGNTPACPIREPLRISQISSSVGERGE